jgi:hypothetical protein
VSSFQSFAGLGRLHFEYLAGAVQVVEESGHGGNLYNFPVIVMPAKPREQILAQLGGIDGELAGERQCRFLLVAEWTVFELQQSLQLLRRGTVPRSLRGM